MSPTAEIHDLRFVTSSVQTRWLCQPVLFAPRLSLIAIHSYPCGGVKGAGHPPTEKTAPYKGPRHVQRMHYATLLCTTLNFPTSSFFPSTCLSFVTKLSILVCFLFYDFLCLTHNRLCYSSGCLSPMKTELISDARYKGYACDKWVVDLILLQGIWCISANTHHSTHYQSWHPLNMYLSQ